MKRFNLVLNEKLLQSAKVLLGEKTFSATVTRSLEETVKLIKIRKLNDFFGSGILEETLSRRKKAIKKIKNMARKSSVTESSEEIIRKFRNGS